MVSRHAIHAHLKAENERLKRQLSRECEARVDNDARLRKQIDELRAALEPFAAYVDHVNSFSVGETILERSARLGVAVITFNQGDVSIWPMDLIEAHRVMR